MKKILSIYFLWIKNEKKPVSLYLAGFVLSDGLGG